MKKIPLLLLIASVGFSSQISMNKKFSTKLVPDRLCTNLSISTTNDKETEAFSVLSKYGKYFSELDEKYPDTIKGGNYSVNPKYAYENNKRVFKGYGGYVSYTICKSIHKTKQPAKDIDNIIKDVYKLKEKKPTQISARSGGWQVSPVYYTKAEDELKLKSIIWGEKYSKVIASNINKKCETKNININNHSNYVPYRKNRSYGVSNMKMTSASADVAPAPIKSDEIINLNVSYTYECK